VDAIDALHKKSMDRTDEVGKKKGGRKKKKTGGARAASTKEGDHLEYRTMKFTGMSKSLQKHFEKSIM